MSHQFPPVFIVGAQRSGTTMLRLMLNAHPSFSVPFETDFLSPLTNKEVPRELQDRTAVESALDALAREKFTAKGQIITDRDAILACPIRSYADLLNAAFGEYARARGKPRWGVKTPSYQTQLDLLHELFPDSRIIHIVRDGRDVLVSRRRIRWARGSTPQQAHDWRWQVLLGHKLGRMLGPHYCEIRYEDLVDEPENVLRGICDFVGEPYDDQMLRYRDNSATEMPQESMKWHKMSVLAPDKSKKFEWKKALSLPDQIIFQEIAGDALSEFGYEIVVRRAKIRTGLKRIYYALPGAQ
jgi:hypothetical protein